MDSLYKLLHSNTGSADQNNSIHTDTMPRPASRREKETPPRRGSKRKGLLLPESDDEDKELHDELEEPRKLKSRDKVVDDLEDAEEADEDSEDGSESEEEPPPRKKGAGSQGSGSSGKRNPPPAKKNPQTPVSQLAKAQGAARGFSTPLGEVTNLETDPNDPSAARFARERPRHEGGIRSAAKYLALATLHTNGRGAVPYPSERQYMGMIADYEEVPKWWDHTGAGEPTTTLQKQLLKNWPWIKATLAVTFTNTRARLKGEATRLFYTLYHVPTVQVTCFYQLTWVAFSI